MQALPFLFYNEIYRTMVGALDCVEDIRSGDAGTEIFGYQEIVYAPPHVPLAGVHPV